MLEEHLSITQVNMYRRCPAQYYFRYVQGLKLPPSLNMAVGSSVHDAAEVAYRAKQEGDLVDPKEAADIAVASLEERLDEIELSPTDNVSKAKDAAAGSAELYVGSVVPTVVPALVEAEMVTVIDGVDKPVLGYVDVFDEATLGVRDLKVVSRTPNELVAAKSLQIAFYSFALTTSGRLVRNAIIDSVVTTKEPKHVVSAVRVDDQMMRRAVDTVRGVAEAIRAGLFYPNDDNIMCSPTACGYWELCRSEYPRTKSIVF
jgi:CRISPR/Cas system-associated exonuclease Cas4 (RecB family)